MHFCFRQFVKFSCVVVRLVVGGDAFPTSLSAVRLWEVSRICKCPPTCDGIIHNVIDFSQLPLLRLVIVMPQRFTVVWKAATNPEGAAKTQLFKKSPSRYPWSKMQNGQQNAGRSATLEIYALLLGMGKWRGTSAKAIQGVPKGIKRTDTKKSAEKSRESGS